MLRGQTGVAALAAQVQQEFERREELLKKIHEAEAREAGGNVELTKTEIIQRRIQVLTAMLAEEKPSDDRADRIANARARSAIEFLKVAEAADGFEKMGEARGLIEAGGARN